MVPTVQSVLRRLGPLSSSEVRKVIEQRGLSAEAARQRVSRARDGVRRLSGLRLPQREVFLFLDDQFATPGFWQSLLRTLDRTNSVYGTTVHALTALGGTVATRHFPIYCGGPRAMKRQITADQILRDMTRVTAIRGDLDPDQLGTLWLHGAWPGLSSLGPSNPSARQVAEQILIDGIAGWVRRLGLGAYGKVLTRTDLGGPLFGNFAWCITAPSYILPIATSDRGQMVPGFFACDVLLADEVSEKQIAFFLRKVAILRNQPKTRPFLAMLIANGFQRNAFKAGRRHGVLLATPDQLLGFGTGDALRSLVRTLSNAAAIAATNPDQIGVLFASLSKIEGAAGNLRGPLFEMVVGHCARSLYGGSIEIGEPVLVDDAVTDIDVLCYKGRAEVWSIECKGIGPGAVVTQREIEYWRTVQIPLIRKWLAEQQLHRSAAQHFEFWTSGSFDDEALAELRKAATVKKSKYTVAWKSGKDVLSSLRTINARRLVDVFSEHFIKHPLAKTPRRRRLDTVPSQEPPAASPAEMAIVLDDTDAAISDASGDIAC